MEKPQRSHTAAFTGIFSALCILFQSAPVFIPAVGLLLSPFSTLPILMVSMIIPKCGLWTWFISSIMLFWISPQEAFIFMCTTGGLGLTIGLTLRRGMMVSTLLSAMQLLIGLLILIHVIGVAAFGEWTGRLSSMPAILALCFFSLIYSMVWVFAAKNTISRWTSAIQLRYSSTASDRKRASFPG